MSRTPGFLARILGLRSERPLSVTLVTKAECGLCDEMKRELARARPRVPFRLEEVDLLSSPELAERYALEVPVLLIEGQRAFAGRTTAEAFAEALERRARERPLPGPGGTGKGGG